jgi:hypothetical protein
VLIPGVIVTVRAAVTAVAGDGLTASVRVVDDNGGFLTAAVPLPAGILTVVSIPLTVGDVLEKSDTGASAVVRWVAPTNNTQWSPAVSGSPAWSSLGWRKIGTFTPTP